VLFSTVIYKYSPEDYKPLHNASRAKKWNLVTNSMVISVKSALVL